MNLGVISVLVIASAVVVSTSIPRDLAQATTPLTWGAPTSVSNFVVTDIEFGNDTYVMVGGQDPNKTGEVGGVRISSDGTTWTTPPTPPTDRDWRFAAYGNNTWIIAASNFSTGWIARSTDNGSTWTETDVSSTVKGISILEYVNGRFFIGGIDSTYYRDLFSSTNGASWSSSGFVTCYNRNSQTCNFGMNDDPNGLVFVNGNYVVTAGRYMARSTDLVSWTDIAVPAGFTTTSMTYGNGKYLVHDQWSSNVLTSTDGESFTSELASHRVTRTRFVGSEWFALDAAGFSSKFYRSTDGLTWSMSFMDNDPDNDPNTDSLSTRFTGLVSAGGDLVAVTDGSFSPVASKTVKTSFPPVVTPLSQTISGTAGTMITSSQAFSAMYFQGAVQYSVTSGSLPAGLSMDASTGVISGTPSDASSVTVTITAAGATFGTATATVSFNIAAAPTTTTTTTTTLPAAATTTTLAPTTTIAGSPIVAAGAPRLITPTIQAQLTAAPGEASALINGQKVPVETVKAPVNASPEAQLDVAEKVVNEIADVLPRGTKNPLAVVETPDGAEISGLMTNPDDPKEKLNVPVEAVTLVKAGDSKVLISALNQTNLPAEIASGGVIQVTRGGLVAAQAYGLPENETGEIVLMSTPRLLKTFTVDKSGSYAGQVPLPKNISFGSHTVVMATKSAKVSLGIKLVRTKMQFRIKRKIGTALFKNRAGVVKKGGGKVSISATGRCRANSKRIVMASKPGGCYITVRQAAKGANKAIYYRFTVSVVKKVVKPKTRTTK